MEEVGQGERVEKVEKTRKKAGGKKADDSGDGNAVKGEKVAKPKKTEETVNANATKASPENAKRPVHEKSRAGSMAQKDEPTTVTKTRAHEPESSTNADKSANSNNPEGRVVTTAAPRGAPQPRRVGASATTEAKEEQGVETAVANVSEPELVAPSPALERTRVDTSHAADTLDTADIVIAARDGATSSDIELAVSSSGCD